MKNRIEKFIENVNSDMLKGNNEKINFLILEIFSTFNYYEATFYLAEYFYFKDYIEKSIFCYKKLITSKDYMRAIFGLARCYWKLATVDNNFDFETAVKFYEIVGINGNPIVQYWLGNAYLADKYNMKDEERAIFWYRKASKNGVVLAKYHLGICYLFGIGCSSDFKAALELFNDCYKNGKEEVAFYISICETKIREGKNEIFEE